MAGRGRTAAAAFIGLAVVATACTPSAQSSPSAAPSVLPSAPTASTAPSAVPSTEPSDATAGDWRKVHEVASDDVAQVAREVVHGTAGFLALSQGWVGSEGGPQLTSRTLSHSPDGSAWHGIPMPIPAEEWILALTTTRAGDYLLLTSEPRGESGEQGSLTVVRRSADGFTWEQVDTGLPDDLVVHSLDHGDLGSLLVASVNTLTTSDLGAWFSDDGVSWERVADLDRPGRWVSVQDAGAGAEGFVIVGTDAAAEGDAGHRYFALASDDGRTWIQSEASPFGPEVAGYQPDPEVASIGPDWVAAMTQRDDSIQFYTSPDGLDWEPAGRLELGHPLSVFSPVFAEHGGRLWLSTADGQVPESGDPGIWSSSDGVAWEAVDLGFEGHLGGMASTDELLVLHATEQHGGLDQRATIWVRATP